MSYYSVYGIEMLSIGELADGRLESPGRAVLCAAAPPAARKPGRGKHYDAFAFGAALKQIMELQSAGHIAPKRSGRC